MRGDAATPEEVRQTLEELADKLVRDQASLTPIERQIIAYTLRLNVLVAERRDGLTESEMVRDP